MAHTTIEIRTDDGSCPAHVFQPAGTGPWPGVLMFMDGIGIRPAMFEIGERLASAGYYVLLPDLFYRAGPYTAPEPKQLFADPAVFKAWSARVGIKDFADHIMRDTVAFLAHLDGEPNVKRGPVGLVGYCMGGRMALLAAGRFPDRVAAAAAYHPGHPANDAPDSPHLLAKQMNATIYVGGAMEDPSFPDEQKQRLEQALTEAGVDHMIETYPARHGWVPRDTPVHDAANTERHWQTLLDLFERTLR